MTSNLKASIGLNNNMPITASMAPHMHNVGPQQNFATTVPAPLKASMYQTPKIERGFQSNIIDTVNPNVQFVDNRGSIMNPHMHLYNQDATRQSVVLQQQPQQQVVVQQQPRQVIEKVIEQVIPGEVQIIQRPPEIIEKEVIQKIPGEVIEKVIEKIIPQVQIEERIIEVEKPVEVVVVKERKGPKRIQEKPVYKYVEMVKTQYVPGKDIIIPKHVEKIVEHVIENKIENPIVTKTESYYRDHKEERRLQKMVDRLQALLVPRVLDNSMKPLRQIEVEDDTVYDKVVDRFTDSKPIQSKIKQ